MTRMIELLRDEHRDIEQLLKVLEDELKVFDCRERPDYEIIQAIIDYFQDYPDCCHHPKDAGSAMSCRVLRRSGAGFDGS